MENDTDTGMMYGFNLHEALEHVYMPADNGAAMLARSPTSAAYFLMVR